MTKEFHMNGYRIQYFLYAMLNKRFGRSVKFQRDSLHRQYEVNRHGFVVSGIEPKEVLSFLVEKLQSYSYSKENKHSDLWLNKKTQRNTGNEQINIFLSIQKDGLSVSPHVYWNENYGKK